MVIAFLKTHTHTVQMQERDIFFYVHDMMPLLLVMLRRELDGSCEDSFTQYWMNL